jgi:hypothetical protein
MQKQFMPELKPEDRIRVLRDNHKSEKGKYFVQLSQEDMDLRREQLADNSIKYFELSEELKKKKAEFKEQMEPLTRDNQQIMQELKTGQAENDGELFFVPNYEPRKDFPKGSMEIYDDKGYLISERRLQPGEQQDRLHFIKPETLKPAANDQ